MDAKVKLITKEEAKSRERQSILETLIKKIHKCKILTDAYQKDKTEDFLRSPEFIQRCAEADDELNLNNLKFDKKRRYYHKIYF